MKIALFNEVSLARDMSELGLFQGDVATVVDHLPSTAASGGEEGSVLEVFQRCGRVHRGPWPFSASDFSPLESIRDCTSSGVSAPCQHQSRSIVLAKSDRHVAQFAFAFKL